MLSADRHKRILNRLSINGQLEVSVLAAELGCSEKTIRRDLETLGRAGRLRRVHGGAVQIDGMGIVPVEHRLGREQRAKQTIAGLAVERIPEGATVFLGASSTTLALAARLVDRPAVTVVTNMIDIAQVLYRADRHRVFMAGGELVSTTHSVRGPETLQFVGARLFDIVVCGASGIDTDHGIMGPTDWHVAYTSILLQRTRHFMIVAATSKFGQQDRYRLCDLSSVDTLVTNQQPEPRFQEHLSANGVEVVHP